MSQVVVEFITAPAQSQFGETSIASIQGAQSEEITSSGTSQATTKAALYAGSAASVINNGTDTVWVKFGASPTAAVEDLFIVAPNTQRDFGDLRVGDKAAVINDS